MGILLIQPPWLEIFGRYKNAAKIGTFDPPLGLCYLASAVERDGHSVRILDAEAERKNIEEIVEEVRVNSPDLVGITSTTPTFYRAVELANKIKREKAIPIVLGGAHITALPEQVMQEYPFFDYGVYGEGERTFSELVNALEIGGPIDRIKGILFRREDGQVIKTEPRPFEQDLDSLSFPDRGLLRSDRYLFSVPHRGIIPYTGIVASRGCPFQCVFCFASSMSGIEVRYRSPSKILDEIAYVVSTLRINHFRFFDNNLILNRKRLRELCNGLIKRKLDITWEGETCINIFDEDLLSLMKRAGLVRLSFGLESGNPEILKAIGKDVSERKIRTAYKMAKKLGIETRSSIILGLPYETKMTVMETLRFIRNIKECDQAYINIATPYPGTKFYKMALNGESGIRLLSKDYSKYNRYGNAVIEVNDLTRADLIRFQKKGFRIFYLTPRRIYYNLKRAGLRAAILNIFAFLRAVL
jgi:radical SAM superfamily enzyme YgiQ (UPF0313 family)